MTPFEYPNSSHVRRHGPDGYTTYESYRLWLRDEFTFRCVYCLKREQWGVLKAAYNLDHFEAQARQPNKTLDYDNLLYACGACNTAKGVAEIPDPCTCMLKNHVVVREDGSVSGTTLEAKRIIGKLGLDSPDYREFRMLFIQIVQLAAKHDRNCFRTLMKYPDDLPDLASLRPPQNNRPQGIHDSFHARRERGDLPETY